MQTILLLCLEERHFYNWYTREGMEEMEFIDALTDIGQLISEYCSFCCCDYSDNKNEEDDEGESENSSIKEN